MRPRLLARAPILALVLAGAAACGSVREPRLPAAHAVVIHAPDREAEAERAAAALVEAGLTVEREPEGPPVRTRSSVVVYQVARRQDLLGTVKDALAAFPDLEWLPSVHAGPPGTQVVVWFVSAERDAASRATERPAGE